ncbi:MAG: hypothetical protein ACFFC7_08870 [Candidatus Hermodarchaeota archaeon]
MIEELENLLRLINAYIYGFSSVSQEYAMRERFFHEVEKKALLSFLKGLEAPPIAAEDVSVCRWYIDMLGKQGYLKPENYTLIQTSGKGFKVYVKECSYQEACKLDQKEGRPLHCYRTRIFAILLESILAKNYRIDVREFNPEKQCIIDASLPIPESKQKIDWFAEQTKQEELSMSILALKSQESKLLVTTPLDFLPHSKKRKTKAFLKDLAIYYMNVLVQANEFATGLYGPLPVKNYPNVFTLLYGFWIDDPEASKIAGSQQKTYCVLCFFFRKGMEQFMGGARRNLEQHFRTMIREARDITELNPEFLERVIEHLRVSFMY